MFYRNRRETELSTGPYAISTCIQGRTKRGEVKNLYHAVVKRKIIHAGSKIDSATN